MKESNNVASAGERFKVKFVNSYWTAFDTENYENVQLFALKKDAVAGVKHLNQLVKGGK